MWGVGNGKDAGNRRALQAGWVRRRYFIRDGYIRPIQGSEVVVYDPFEEYYGTDAARSGRSLYQHLVDLDLSDERAIEEFASRWGLLGLFQHRLVQVSHVGCDRYDYADHPDQPPTSLSHWNERPGNGPLDRREGPTIHLIYPDDYLRADEDERRSVRERGHQLFRKWLAETRYPYGSVIVENAFGVLEEVEQDAYYSQFFLDLELARAIAEEDTRTDLHDPSRKFLPPRRSRYPRISSPRLWDCLCEPLDLFREAAYELRDLYTLTVRASSPDAHAAPSSQAADYLRQDFAQRLSRVHPLPGWQEQSRSWTMAWSFPSLLSAAYAMLFVDFVVAGRKLRFCANETCGKSFVSDRSDRKYCSERCQNAAKQREFRRAKKAAVDPQKGGSM